MSASVATITRNHRGRRYTGRQPRGRVCESKGCTTVLSVYNDDTICARCYEAISLEDLPLLPEHV